MFKINKKIFWLGGIFYALVFFFLLKNSFSYIDPDLGWHLKFGQEILNSGDVPRINLINYTIYKASWVDHEWLSDFLSYIIYDKFGYIALNIFFALLALAALGMQQLTAKKFFGLSGRVFLVFLPLQLFGLYGSAPSLGVRPQEFTLFFLGVLLFIFYHYEKFGDKKILFWLPPFFWLWASLHGGFLLGVGLLFFFAGAKIVENLLFKFYRPKFLAGEAMSFKKIAIFGGGAAVSLLATLLTPYKTELYSFLTSYSNNFYLGTIFEWFHQFRYPFFYAQLAYLQIAALIFIWWAIRTFWLKKNNSTEKISLLNLLLSIFFFYMACKSRRHFPLFFMAILPLLAFLSAEFFNLKKIIFAKEKLKNWQLNKWLKAFLFLIFINAAALQVLTINFISNPWEYFGYKYPYEAVQFLKAHPEYDGLRLFNDFNWGGYLIWVLPGKQLFIDGRLPQYPYKNKSLLEEYYSFIEAKQPEEKLREYKIEMAILSSGKLKYSAKEWEKKIFKIEEDDFGSQENKKSPLGNFLSSSLDWQLVYRGEVAEIFVRKEAVSQK